jgi:hypothetical protein
VVGPRFCWVVLRAPTGKRLAPVMGELVATLRRFGELDVSNEVAAALTAMSVATMNRAPGSGQGWADVAWGQPHQACFACQGRHRDPYVAQWDDEAGECGLCPGQHDRRHGPPWALMLSRSGPGRAPWP